MTAATRIWSVRKPQRPDGIRFVHLTWLWRISPFSRSIMVDYQTQWAMGMGCTLPTKGWTHQSCGLEIIERWDYYDFNLSAFGICHERKRCSWNNCIVQCYAMYIVNPRWNFQDKELGLGASTKHIFHTICFSPMVSGTGICSKRCLCWPWCQIPAAFCRRMNLMVVGRVWGTSPRSITLFVADFFWHILTSCRIKM